MAIARELITDTLEYDGGRRVTVYVPPDPPEAVVFAADGAWHITRLAESLERTGVRATMVVGVHGLADDDGRLLEYVPGFDDARFAAHEEFFVHGVGRWIEQRFGVALPPDRTGVWGASLGGELALALGMRHPEVFGAIFCLSPGAGYRPPEMLSGPVPRVYLAAGRDEPFFSENAARWAEALRTADAEVVMMEREGEHGGTFWIEEFPLMVAWGFGG